MILLIGYLNIPYKYIKSINKSPISTSCLVEIAIDFRVEDTLTHFGTICCGLQSCARTKSEPEDPSISEGFYLTSFDAYYFTRPFPSCRRIQASKISLERRIRKYMAKLTREFEAKKIYSTQPNISINNGSFYLFTVGIMNVFSKFLSLDNVHYNSSRFVFLNTSIPIAVIVVMINRAFCCWDELFQSIDFPIDIIYIFLNDFFLLGVYSFSILVYFLVYHSLFLFENCDIGS